MATDESLTESPTMYQRLVGLELEQLRLATDPPMERKVVAKALGCAVSKIGHLENARNHPSYADLKAMTALYGRPDRLDVLWMRTTLGHRRGWWENTQNKDLSGPESFGTYVGLLQVRGYIEAGLRAYDRDASAEVIGELVQIRLRRQELLRRTQPPHLHFVLGEAALRHRTSETDVMIAQLRHLIDLMEHPAVTLQVLTFEAGVLTGHHGAFTVMSFPHDPEIRDPGVVYVETLLAGRWHEPADDVTAYRNLFKDLANAALPPDKSVDMIHHIIKELR